MSWPREPWRMGYRDGSGKNVLTAKVGRKRTGLLVAWSGKGCGCCAGDTKPIEQAALERAASCVNACAGLADPCATMNQARHALLLTRARVKLALDPVLAEAVYKALGVLGVSP